MEEHTVSLSTSAYQGYDWHDPRSEQKPTFLPHAITPYQQQKMSLPLLLFVVCFSPVFFSWYSSVTTKYLSKSYEIQLEDSDPTCVLWHSKQDKIIKP